MSIERVAWVLAHSETQGGERLVLTVLAYHADEDGECWPSLDTIARETRLSRRSVVSCIANMQGRHITVLQGGGRGRSNRYRLLLNSEAASPFEHRNSEAETVFSLHCLAENSEAASQIPDTNCEVGAETVKLVQLNSEAASPERSLERSLEKSLLETRAIPKPLRVPPELQEFHRILRESRADGYKPTSDFLAKVLEKYRGLDLDEEAIKMAGWIASRRGRKLSTAFVLGWLRRAATGDGAATAAQRNGPIGGPGPPATAWREQVSPGLAARMREVR